MTNIPKSIQDKYNTLFKCGKQTPIVQPKFDGVRSKPRTPYDDFIDAIQRKKPELAADAIATIIQDHYDEDEDCEDFIYKMMQYLENHC